MNTEYTDLYGIINHDYSRLKAPLSLFVRSYQFNGNSKPVKKHPVEAAEFANIDFTTAIIPLVAYVQGIPSCFHYAAKGP